MNLPAILGKKIEQTQAFLEDGTRVPLTRVWVGDNSISQTKTSEKEGYMAVQVAFGKRNKISKPLTGHLKKAGLKNTPRFLREIRVEDVAGFENGTVITPEEVLAAGDKVDVVGVSKGKGFAGAVKRWGFHGGPKTHGQSDRHRAPGSIGQGTTPGRVYKGKKMAGRMGSDRVTIKNLEIAEVKNGEVLIKGLIPGPKGNVVMITKIGENKKFKPLFSITSEEVIEEVIEEEPKEEVVEKVTDKVEEASVSNPEVKVEEKIEAKVDKDAPVEEAVSDKKVSASVDEDTEKTEEPSDAKAMEGEEKAEDAK